VRGGGEQLRQKWRCKVGSSTSASKSSSLKGGRLRHGLLLQGHNRVWAPRNKEVGCAEMMSLNANK